MFFSTQTTPPSTLPVPLAEFKTFLRQDNDAEDDLLTTILESAYAEAEEYVQRSLVRQERELRITGTPPPIVRLDMGPVLSVDSVKYLDADLVEQTMDPADYVLRGDHLYTAPDVSWPYVTTEREGGFVVAYHAGIVDDTESPVPVLPAKTRTAIMLLGQLMYDRNVPAAEMLRHAAYRQLDTVRVGQGV